MTHLSRRHFLAIVKVAGVAEFAPGQTLLIGSGAAGDTVVIESVGTAGSTRVRAAGAANRDSNTRPSR